MTLIRRACLTAAVLALFAAAVQIGIGGFSFHVGGVRISSHSAVRPLVVAILLAAVLWRRGHGAGIRSDVRALDSALERLAPWLAASAAALALAVGIVWGTRAAGGSDSYCYIGQAEEFAAGRVILREPLAQAVPLPRADLVFAPVGWVPAPRGGAVPMCPPGLSLVMALAWRIGGPLALHLVVPFLGALAVWAAYLVGRRMNGPTAGAYAAVLLAASPVFLHQVVQPMSDVPAAAWWSVALALVARRDAAGQIGGGAFASLALLTRPNLAPAVLPLVAFIFACGTGTDRSAAGRLRAVLRFGGAMVPGCTALAWLNHVRYGSPFRTGYGDLETLFSLSHVGPNAWRYAHWLLEGQTPFILLALPAPLVVRWAGDRSERVAFMWMGLAFAVTVLACYLPYTVFEAWWYTRFLLPALPIALALAAACAVTVASRWPAGVILLLVIVGAVTVRSISFARSHDAFALRDFERRYVTAGTYVGRLPENAVVITIQESGAVRHYGRRPAALWDALDPTALDETVAALRLAGRTPYFLLEDWEEAGFRARFAGERLGGLDWPAQAVIRDRVSVRLYDPADRDRSARGEAVPTHEVPPAR